MLKQKKQMHILILLILDILAIVLADITSVYIRFNTNFFEETKLLSIPIEHYYKILILVLPVVIFIYIIFKLYKNPLDARISKDIRRLITANIVSALILMSLTFIIKEGWNYSRFVLASFIFFNIIYSIIFRIIHHSILKKNYNSGENIINILVIGTSNVAIDYLKTIKNYKKYGYIVKGILSLDSKLVGNGLLGYPIIGTIDEFTKLQNENKFDEVVIALQMEQIEQGKNIINKCDAEGVRVKFIPSYYEFLKVDMNIESLDGIPMLVVRDVPLDTISNQIVKRIFDICFSTFAILASSPIMIFVALGVKITSPGPIFFKQERVGLKNKTFNMLKFRSMKVQKESDTNVVWTTQNDPRKTKFGSFIRKTSLDELPQFFNVFLGDMSIVGPRPERPYWVNKFKDEIPEYMLRHYVKSGITGWAQVNGWRGDTSIEERIKCDNYYIQNWSLLFDIKIIFLTVFKGFVNKNAY